MKKCVFMVLAMLLSSTTLRAQETVEEIGYRLYQLGVQAAKADPETKKKMMAQIQSLQQRRDALIKKGEPARADLPEPPVPRSGGVSRPDGNTGPATDWSRGSYSQGGSRVRGGGGNLPNQVGWFQQYGGLTPGQNAFVTHRGSYRTNMTAPYIGKNGTVSFAGFQFGPNGFNGPMFQTNRYGGNFFGIPIRFR